MATPPNYLSELIAKLTLDESKILFRLLRIQYIHLGRIRPEPSDIFIGDTEDNAATLSAYLRELLNKYKITDISIMQMMTPTYSKDNPKVPTGACVEVYLVKK